MKFLMLGLSLIFFSCIDDKNVPTEMAKVVKGGKDSVRKNSRIAEAITKNGYIYIPSSALSDSSIAIHYNYPSKNTESEINKRPIRLYWHSPCTDGSYNLTITPEQVYFHSSHDNPNPNHLYWVLDITSLQFEKIRRGITEEGIPGFKDYSNNTVYSITNLLEENFISKAIVEEEWTDEELDRFGKACDIERKKQLKKYFGLLNSFLSYENDLDSVPSDLKKPKLFGRSLEEMQYWMPLRK